MPIVVPRVCLDDLRLALERVGRGVPGARLATGVDGDAAIPASDPFHLLRPGAVHEFLSGATNADRPKPPLALLGHLTASLRRPSDPRLTAWVGPAVFPSVWALARAGDDDPLDPTALERHLLIDARPAHDRLWAADLALRSNAAACVVVDGARFDSAATRRLQLGAEAHAALCFLARPASDLAELSTAATRWLAEPSPSPHHSCARWTVRLLRCKGLRPTTHHNAWTVDIPHAPRDGRVPPLLRDGPARTLVAPVRAAPHPSEQRPLRFG